MHSRSRFICLQIAVLLPSTVFLALTPLPRHRQILAEPVLSRTISQVNATDQRHAQTLNDAAGSYYTTGQYQRAIETYQQSLELFRQIGNRAGEAKVLSNLGDVYTALGQYQQAVQFYTQALKIRQQIDDRRGQAVTLGNLSTAYIALQDSQQAIEFGRQAINFLDGIEESDLTSDDFLYKAAVLNMIAEANLQKGEYQQAIEFYQQARTLAQQFLGATQEVDALMGLGQVHFRRNEYQEANEFYQQALEITQGIIYPSGQSRVLSYLGDLMSQQNQPELAILFYKQSVNLTEKIRQNVSLTERQTYLNTVAETYRRLADLLLQRDRVLEAQQVLDLLKIQELDDYLRGVRGTGQQLVILRPEEEILAKYNALQQSAIALGQERSLLQQRLSRGETLSASQQQRLDQLLQLEKELNQQFNQFSTSPEIIALLDQLSPSVLRQSVPLEDLAALQDDLKSLNAVLLYPLVLEDRLELVITTPNAPPLRRSVNVSKADLNQAILAFRQALENPGSDATQPAQQLYEWLIKPIEADLAQANAQTIIYAPDGQLRYIPLAALHNGNEWLVQQYRVNNITAKSLTDLNAQPTTQPRILAGAFADPTVTYNIAVGQQQQNFQGLPFAGQEVKNLSSAFPNTTSLVDRAFSLAATQRSMNASNILHLATHAAFVSGAPENSFILFGNGEQSTLTDIGTWSLQNIDLVVLSACETGLGGLGNGEEILGLGYQFQVRGARAVLASLWRVSDGGTQALMSAFYAALQQNGITKSEAIRQAQIALITGNYTVLEDESRGIVGIRQRIEQEVPAEITNQLSHPYYWAPFILIGNGL